MFQQILYVHWKGARMLLIPFVVAAFGAPIVAVQPVGRAELGVDTPWGATSFLEAARLLVPLFPAVAAGVGAVVALTAWNWDHKHEHMYALSLPVPRWEYALQKMGAGMLLLLVPSAFFWGGSLLAASMVQAPPGIEAYPTALAGRFLLGSLIVYSLVFALGAGTMKTTVMTLSSLVGVVLLGTLTVDLLANAFPIFESVSFGGWLYELVMSWPGPFEAFSGNWTLFDV